MKECPAEFLEGERFAFIKGTPQLLGTPYKGDDLVHQLPLK